MNMKPLSNPPDMEGVFKYEANENGNRTSKTWEWK
jgi:hypothetical protein